MQVPSEAKGEGSGSEVIKVSVSPPSCWAWSCRVGAMAGKRHGHLCGLESGLWLQPGRKLLQDPGRRSLGVPRANHR